MAILYPPYIEGTLPAFVGNTIEVPYMMNKTVGYGDIEGFKLKIKSIQTNKTLATLTSYEYTDDVVTFTVSNSKVIAGQFYKVQLAYLSEDGETGYFSTIGIVKKTYTPSIKIVDKNGNQLSKTHSQLDKRVYIGRYSNNDIGEKVYTYRFDVYDYHGRLFTTSGDLLHNHENDKSSDESYDEFVINKTLEDNKIYKIKYTITTVNGYEISSYSYKITRRTTIDPIMNVNLLATVEEENGYIQLTFEPITGDKEKDEDYNLAATGTFIILRASSRDNFETWNTISNFTLEGQLPYNWSWKDYTITHGEIYSYALQQYNKTNQIFSNRRYSNSVLAKFEHTFLFDGERQLKIKFNPKVSSYKRTFLEAKQDTLGGKYPYFYRNGNTNYAEFPISGLISYHSDEKELFLSNEDMYLYGERWFQEDLTWDSSLNEVSDRKTGDRTRVSENNRIRTTNLVDYNVFAEKTFRNEVLDFLTNGKPKMFKSPTENNAIVRLMNVSLSPNDQLGRMLYSFNATAYEVDDYNFETLNKHGFISTNDPYIKQIRVHTVIVKDFINEIKEENKDKTINIENYKINKKTAYFIDCKDMWPGDIIIIDNKQYVIGVTGSYFIKLKEKTFNSIKIGKNHSGNGSITYGYYSFDFDTFSLYKDVKIVDIPLIQIFGQDMTTIKTVKTADGGTNQELIWKDIIEPYNDVKYILSNFNFLRFTKRTPLDDNEYDALEEDDVLKRLYIKKSEAEKSEENQNDLYKDAYIIKIVQEVHKINENGQITPETEKETVVLDIRDTDGYQLYSHDNIKELYIGRGIIAELSLSRREIIYTLETEIKEVKNAKKQYIEALENYNKSLDWDKYNTMKTYYEIFITKLQTTIDKLKRGEEVK